MTNLKMVVTKETWANIPDDEKLWMIFNTVQSLQKRVTQLERGGWLHKGLAFTGGVMGGAACFLGFRWGGLR